MINTSLPTYRSLANYTEQQWHIMIETFEHLKLEPITKSVIDIFGDEGLYEQLSYHQKIIKTASELGSFALLTDYLNTRYRLFISRGIDAKYFLIETNYWCNAIRHFLFEPYAVEFVALYNQMLTLHDTLSAIDTSYVLTNSLVDQLTQALINTDEAKAREIFNSHLDEFHSPVDFLDQVVKPALILIGIAWESAHISVAKEHIATAIVERIWGSMAKNLLQNDDTNRSVIIITPDSQLHKLGSKMVATFMESKGWKVAQINLNENDHEVYRAIDLFHPNLIICSVMLPICIPLIQKFVSALKVQQPIYEGKIAAGGQAFYRSEPPILLKNIDFQSSSLIELEKYIDSL